MFLLPSAWAYETGLPQRHGSQGFGPAQSQSSVGQARTQFIPPPPSMGQRNQYGSQGVVRAPHTA